MAVQLFPTTPEELKRVELTLPWPPSGNRYFRMITIKGRPRMVVSKAAKDYAREVVRVISAEQSQQMVGRLSVSIVCYAPDRRRYDLDNRVKVLLDAIERAGLIANDEQIDELNIRRGDVKKPGRVEIVFCELCAG